MNCCVISETAIKRSLTKSDLLELNRSLDSTEITKQFEADWNSKANAYIHKAKSQNEDSSDCGELMKLNAIRTEAERNVPKIPSPSLLVSIAKVADCNFIGIVLLEIVTSLLKIAGPMCLE